MERAMALVDLVLEKYRYLDRLIERFRNATGLKCLRGCSYCCRNWPVEATVLEVLPLAREIYARGEEASVLGLIEQKQAHGDETCVFLLPESEEKVPGYCAYYKWRPLMCRLFGFAARRNKHGELEFCGCKLIRESDPSSIKRAVMALRENLKLPVYQDAFIQINTLDLSRGYRRLPINQAIKEAIEYLYWVRPPAHEKKKALRC